MFLTYVNRVGDPGFKNSPTEHLVLGAVLVHERDWCHALDGLIDLRRRLKETYNISSRDRIKPYDFIRGSGSLRDLHLSFRVRHRLLKGLFKYQAKELPVRVFAVAIQKNAARKRAWTDSSQAAWTFLLQRLQRFAQEKDERILLITEADLALDTRRLVRQMRRYHRVPFLHSQGDRRIDVRRLVEDPLVLSSADESYWIQLADWNAYAALRSSYIEPREPWTEDLWDLLGTLRLQEVSRLRGGPPGIVRYP